MLILILISKKRKKGRDDAMADYSATETNYLDSTRHAAVQCNARRRREMRMRSSLSWVLIESR